MREIVRRRSRRNRLGFAYQIAFVRVLGRFPRQSPLEIEEEILRFAALQLGIDPETIHAYADRQQTVSEHQQHIGQYLCLRAFDATADKDLARFLEDEAFQAEDAHLLTCISTRIWLVPCIGQILNHVLSIRGRPRRGESWRSLFLAFLYRL